MPNAIELLKKDHREVEKLFKKFESEQEADAMVDIVQKICEELTVHAQIEEEIFYPAARKSSGENDLIDEAQVEHNSLKYLIDELNGQTPDDKLFAAKVTVLKEYVQHHVKEEEKELFPKLEKSGFDADAVGKKLETRKQELMVEIENVNA